MADDQARERAEHLITLADEVRGKRCWLCHELNAECKCRQMWLFGGRPKDHGGDIPDEAEWVARQLLEALGRIEQLEAENAWLLGERRKL